MVTEKLIWAGQEAKDFSREQVGGKGLSLLRLYSYAQSSGMFSVPNFFIIPEDYPYGNVSGADANFLDFESDDVKKAFEKLNHPAIARSSSPLEDGINASFAGMFLSRPDQNDYHQLTKSLYDIRFSAFRNFVEKYSERMGVDFDPAMAFIVQEQITNFLERGVIQLDETEGIIEIESPSGRKWSHDIDYEFLNEYAPWGIYEEPHDYISEGETHNATQCAREAKKALGLEGVVQVEFLLRPSEKPHFVQIRQLPNIKNHSAMLDMEIPEGAPYLESQVCNGVAGEVTLPAYVTFSQSGFPRILIETGIHRGDERMQTFYANSKLAGSAEFANASNFNEVKRIMGVRECISYFEKMWAKGNARFPEYVLVCDKLDETIAGMTRLTEGKRAVITCLEARKTSHAMTVARDLGIPAMGVEGEISDSTYFYNQVETGDLIHLKSDGKRAIAYVEKTRE